MNLKQILAWVVVAAYAVYLVVLISNNSGGLAA
jgi:hypothetical protein